MTEVLDAPAETESTATDTPTETPATPEPVATEVAPQAEPTPSAAEPTSEPEIRIERVTTYLPAPKPTRPEDITRAVHDVTIAILTRNAEDWEDYEGQRAAADHQAAEMLRLHARLKEAAKSVQGHLENIGERLDQLERRRDQEEADRNSPAPLFDDPSLRNHVNTGAFPVQQHAAEEEKPAEPAVDDAWKATPITDLEPKLKPSVLAKLADQSIETVGAMASWMELKGEFWAKDLKGIGPKARDEIETAMENFWIKRGSKPAAPESQQKIEQAVAEMTGPVGLDVLGCTKADIEEAFHPRLPVVLAKEKTAELPDALRLKGHGGLASSWYAVTIPGEDESGDYRLLKLIPVEDDYQPDGSAGTVEGDPLCGYRVTVYGAPYVIGPKAQQVLVKA